MKELDIRSYFRVNFNSLLVISFNCNLGINPDINSRIASNRTQFYML